MEAWIAGLVVAGLLALIVVTGRRVAGRAVTLQIWRAMARRGIKPEDSEGDGRAMAVAVRRCALCSSVEECEHWLAGGQGDPAAFCPNTMFMENLQRAKRRATVKR